MDLFRLEVACTKDRWGVIEHKLRTVEYYAIRPAYWSQEQVHLVVDVDSFTPGMTLDGVKRQLETLVRGVS